MQRDRWFSTNFGNSTEYPGLMPPSIIGKNPVFDPMHSIIVFPTDLNPPAQMRCGEVRAQLAPISNVACRVYTCPTEHSVPNAFESFLDTHSHENTFF